MLTEHTNSENTHSGLKYYKNWPKFPNKLFLNKIFLMNFVSGTLGSLILGTKQNSYRNLACTFTLNVKVERLVLRSCIHLKNGSNIKVCFLSKNVSVFIV